MRAKLIYLDHNETLEQIYHHLKTQTQFAQNPYFDSYFDKITKQVNHKEPVFAIGFDHKSPHVIKLIYTIHTEYKLTRQLCKCVHIEEIFVTKDVKHKQIEGFHKDLLPQLNCYKIVALGIQENSILKPNQKFMTVESKPML